MDVYDDDVIKSLGSKASTVKQLVKHERNKLVINTKGAYYYKNAQGKYILLTGLLPRLRKTFFPDTNIYNLLKKPKVYKEKISKHRRMALARQNNTLKEPKVKKIKSGKGAYYGRIRGTVVHQEIEDFIFLNSKAFQTMKWRLLRSEFDIFDERLGIGTSVDIEAVTNEGKLVLIEVKCGFSGYFDRCDGFMQGALHKLTNSPHHQANIQIITCALFIVKNHQIPLDQMELYVIRVDDEGLTHYRVNNDYVKKKGQKIYQDLLLSS